jgi:hypothetical protein
MEEYKFFKKIPHIKNARVFGASNRS